MGFDDGGSARGRKGPFAFRLLVTVGWLIVIGSAFVLGYLLAGHDAKEAAVRIQTLQTERDALSEALAAERDAHVRLERTHLIDREAKRAAQSKLAELQRERLYLAKQVAYLQGLIRDGEVGAVEVREFTLTEGEGAGEYRYNFTVDQLVPEFGRSEGSAIVKVVLQRNGERETVPLADLPGSSSGQHNVSFDHFQTFDGTIRLPAEANPREIIVDIEPGNNNLMRSSEAFAWRAHEGDGISLAPILSSGGSEAAAAGEK
jgi:hypothetical protein